ncbi:jg18030, partial [Pararge aegeria aegeria]
MFRLLTVLTNKQNVFAALKEIERVTEHYSIDGVIEMLQKMSGRRSLSDVIDYYDHELQDAKGVEGIRRQVYKYTGGVGPSEFASVCKALEDELDWTATFNVLVSAMRCSDIEDAIAEFKQLLGKKSFEDAVALIKKVTGIPQLKYALEALLEETARVSLKVIVETLYQITGKTDLEHVQRELLRLVHIDNIVKVMQMTNKITKKRDPLIIFTSLLDITQTTNLSDCSAAITGLTFKQ